jgi:purine-binding chemotaxis protein CheW
VVRVGERHCALPIDIVRETMRPLPIEAVAGAPAFLRGSALIRGAATSVIDLGTLLDGAPGTLGRVVTLRCDRALALAVDDVRGVLEVEAGAPMLSAATLSALAVIDLQLPVLLARGTTLPGGDA